MHRAARCLALLVSFLSIQLSLFGGGTGCDLGMVVMTSSESMATMDMGATADNARSDPIACDVPSNDGPCTAMTVCVFAAITSSGSAVPTVLAIATANDAAAATTLTSTGFAPDHPPPRA